MIKPGKRQNQKCNHHRKPSTKPVKEKIEEAQLRLYGNAKRMPANEIVKQVFEVERRSQEKSSEKRG